jgi:anaerobic selenocysteine-containing dehydrogenase
MTEQERERLEQNKIACPETGIEIHKSSCCICNAGSHCGMDVYVRDGRIVKAEGDSGNPHTKGHLCPRGAGIRQYVYSPDRILTPLKRTGERGKGKFRPVSWEEAYAEIAARLNAVKAESGPESVAFFSGFSKWYRPVLKRLARSFGSPNYMSEGNVCQEAHRQAWWLTFGDIAGADIEHADTVLVWTRNPFFSNMDNNRRYYEQMEKGKPFIVVDARKTSFAQKAALHLQPLPGTDGALALAMANVIIREDLYDHDFVARFVHGFEEYAALAAQYPAELAEQIASVPAEKIRQAARMYAGAKRAALLTSASPVVHHVNGLQNQRAVVSLVALTGNFDVNGGNRVIPSGYLAVSGFVPSNEKEYVGEFHPCAVPIGHSEFPVWADFLPEEAQGMLLPRAVHEGKPYPVRAVFGVGMNHMMWPDSGYMLSALKKLDFFACVDLFLTETARYADIVLPACSGLERCDVKIFGDGWVQCFPPAIEPLGESRPDIQILFDLAGALGLEDPHLRMRYEDYMDFILEPTGLTVREIQEQGGIVRPKNPVPGYREKKYLEHGFSTPTGKVELYSEVIARYADAYGLDPLPGYRSFREVYPGTDPEKYPLVMCTGARKPQLLHSRTYRMGWLAGLEDPDLLDMNPEDADRLGIRDYDRVRISTPKGSIEATAHRTATVHPGIVHMYHGNEHANTSRLMAHDYLDPYSGYPGYKSFPCRVDRLEKEGERNAESAD